MEDVSRNDDEVSPVRRNFLKVGALAAAAGSIATASLLPATAEAAAPSGIVVPTPMSPPQKAPLPAVLQQSVKHTQIALDIFNSKANLVKGWPLYSPAYFILPAHSLITMSINDYDNGPSPLLPGMEKFAKVSGTVGNVAIYAMNTKGEKATAGVGQIAPGVHSSMSPKQPAHTFTVPAMGLNVPTTALQTVTFMFYTGDPGMYEWLCQAPCGVGSDGMGGPMMVLGYMRGYMFVQ